MLAYPHFPQFSYLRLLEPRPSGYQTPPNPPKLLDQVRTVMRRQHYSIRTEETYTQWISRFIRFHKMRHPQEMDTPEIEAFLNHLAVTERVSASTVRLSSRRSPKSGFERHPVPIQEHPQ